MGIKWSCPGKKILTVDFEFLGGNDDDFLVGPGVRVIQRLSRIKYRSIKFIQKKIKMSK